MMRAVFLPVLAAAMAALPASAADLQISPVSIAFKPGQSAAGITLQNQGESPVYGQVRAFQWTQRDGEDVLTETADVIVSPPIIEVAPRAMQTIRLVRRGAAPAAGEGTYRLLIDEIPRDGGQASGVDILLRYSVPVFMLPAGNPAPQLAWTVLRDNGEWTLRVRNSGTLHAQLGATRLRNTAGTDFDISKGLLGYVLPGQQRSWKLPVPKDAALDGRLAVKTVVNAQATSVETEQ